MSPIAFRTRELPVRIARKLLRRNVWSRNVFNLQAIFTKGPPLARHDVFLIALPVNAPRRSPSGNLPIRGWSSRSGCRFACAEINSARKELSIFERNYFFRLAPVLPFNRECVRSEEPFAANFSTNFQRRSAARYNSWMRLGSLPSPRCNSFFQFYGMNHRRFLSRVLPTTT